MSLIRRGVQFWINGAPKIFQNGSSHTVRSFRNTPILFSNATASFEEVKSVKTNTQTLLIDVREPQELQETGTIPGSINIPLGEIESVLRDMSPEQFKKRFGRDKPNFSAPIIFSCQSGMRSASAQEIAAKLGFKNIKNYQGGWLDWAEHNK